MAGPAFPVERKTYDDLRAEVDARKGKWTEERTPDADRALIKRLLEQAGAWEDAAKGAERRLSQPLHAVVDVGCLECGVPTVLRCITDDEMTAAHVQELTDAEIEASDREAIILTGVLGQEYLRKPEDDDG